jgi:hypothetical protein
MYTYIYTNTYTCSVADGNRCTHDRYDASGVADVIERCLNIMACGGRFLAILTIGTRLHELTHDDKELMERMAPVMLQACEYVIDKVICVFVCMYVFFVFACMYERMAPGMPQACEYVIDKVIRVFVCMYERMTPGMLQACEYVIDKVIRVFVCMYERMAPGMLQACEYVTYKVVYVFVCVCPCMYGFILCIYGN